MQNPEGSEDLQNENPGVSKVEISRGTPGFGVFEEPLAIPIVYKTYCMHFKKVSIDLRNTAEQEKIKKLQRQAKKKSVIANLLI